MTSASQAKTPETQPHMRLSASEADRREGAAILDLRISAAGHVLLARTAFKYAEQACIEGVIWLQLYAILYYSVRWIHHLEQRR